MNKLRNFYHDNFPIIMICGVVVALIAFTLDISLGAVSGPGAYAHFSWQ